MNFRMLKYLIKTDLFRYKRKSDWQTFICEYALNNSFKLGVLLRICRYLYLNDRKISLFAAKTILRHYQVKFGTLLSYKTEIGPGLFLGHLNGIIVSTHAKLGKNSNFSQYITIGSSERGSHTGVTTVGDNVYIAPGAQIFGNITIGNNALIGSNTVVTKDVPANAVVVGVPGIAVSNNGSIGYVNNTDYDDYIKL